MALHFQPPSPADAGRATHGIERLCAIHALVAEMGGVGPAAPLPGATFDAIEQAYANAPTIVRRRIDAVTRETAAFAAAGLDLLQRRQGDDGQAAARRLAGEMAAALHMIERALTR